MMTWTSGPGTFESKMLPHLNAAYTLARWLTGNVQDAEDAVQDAYLRAFRFFSGFRGGDSRAWLLQIVRNTCYTRLRARPSQLSSATFDEEVHVDGYATETPEMIAIKSADIQLVRAAIQELPLKYREVLILREVEAMSYAEMSKILNQPLGNIRTILFRARQQLKRDLIKRYETLQHQADGR
jgi:RNA polymerase sigma-70 factor (ECF subfamily)